MRLGPLFRGTFEVQAGNRPLQGQSKPPVFTGGYDYGKKSKNFGNGIMWDDTGSGFGNV